MNEISLKRLSVETVPLWRGVSAAADGGGIGAIGGTTQGRATNGSRNQRLSFFFSIIVEGTIIISHSQIDCSWWMNFHPPAAFLTPCSPKGETEQFSHLFEKLVLKRLKNIKLLRASAAAETGSIQFWTYYIL